MCDILQYCRPEDVGVHPTWVEDYVNEVNRCRKVQHSFVMARGTRVFAEGYWKPFHRDWLHRMYSVSKSFVSAAIGMLADERRITLEDRIITYFPEQDDGNVHPLIQEMTIRDMLMMATCHKTNSYGVGDANWLRTFFHPHHEPDHPAGTEFRYDTAASYTLDVLVERLTGKTFLEYLKDKALRELEAMCEKYHCYLPPFCHFTPEQWQEIGHEYDEVRDCMLGWDITDYGLGNFDKFGFSLITIRNGNRAMAEKYPKVYAEKLLYLKEGQYAPNHFHWYKTEDIINRGGGNVLIRVYNSLPNEEVDYESDVTVHTDGRTYTVPAGTQIRLTPGESIHVQQFLYHDFAVEEGTGPVLLGEVSQCNDDNTDNRFNPPVGRFPKIEEDEAPYRLLCNEYPAVK